MSISSDLSARTKGDALELNVTPMPQNIVRLEGHGVAVSRLTSVVAPWDVVSQEMVRAALAWSGIELRAVDARRGARLRLEVDTALVAEGYVLEVGGRGVQLRAADASGFFYGLVTLGQMAEQYDVLPPCRITDAPRYRYRGVLIDVSRHFRSLDFLKRQIQLLAQFKVNRLHLHLTDAAGWRVAIQRYSRLTNYAAWRPQALWKDWQAAGGNYCEADDTLASGQAPYGGYYTADELRELVAYAACRGMTIVPEIEMPSHSEEVTAAFPQLSCSGVRQSDLCVGREATFEFLQGVLDEVMDIFPSPYIHIGGDEAAMTAWATCDSCHRRMADEGLQRVEELQSYLICRIERYLNAHGRQIIGWDEILQGGVAPHATVMSWRGVAGGQQAAALGHEVIMTPGEYCYLDSYQDAPATQPEAFGGYLPLEKVFSYEPQQNIAADSLLAGVQANLWCEYIPTDSLAEYMLYPRALALAEVGWTQSERKLWPDFRRRMTVQLASLKARGYYCFDLQNEVGNRPEALAPKTHLAVGKPVTFLRPYWRNYPAAGEATLTDGQRGGWNYNDRRWLAFLTQPRMDVIIDLQDTLAVHSISADFMQVCTPGVFLPARVTISSSVDGAHFSPLAQLQHEVVRTDGVSFKNFGWQGATRCRYVRYQADADAAFGGVLFVDEIVVE